MPSVLTSPFAGNYVGMINYLITCVQCSIQVTLTVQQVIHFTDWVVGHAHPGDVRRVRLIMGMFVDLWPQVVGRAWHSTRMLTGHFWLTLVGLKLMFVALMAAGLV
jgi:cytochrome c oxidase cbb3-type subunit 1